MAITTINVGNAVNDGLGDDLRTAFLKVNANFSDLDARAKEVFAQNLGTTGVGIFKSKNIDTLEFKRLVGTSNLTITDQTNSVLIDSPLQNTFTTVITPAGNIAANSPTANFGITAGNNINIVLDGRNVRISAFGDPTRLNADPNPTLAGDLVLNGYKIIGPGTFQGNLTVTSAGGLSPGTVTSNLVGNVTGLVNGIDITTLGSAFYAFDFGTITGAISNVIQFMLSAGTFDLGVIADSNGDESESPLKLDFGSITI